MCCVIRVMFYLPLDVFPTFMFWCFSFRPDLIDFTYVRNSKPHDRLEYAFTVAERDLGVHRLLDPEGNINFF